MEVFYAKKGQSIDRIRQFSKSAQSKVPPPTVTVAGHEPSEEHVNGLTARPFWDLSEEKVLFPWAAELEENAHVIQEEFEAKIKSIHRFRINLQWQGVCSTKANKERESIH